MDGATFFSLVIDKWLSFAQPVTAFRAEWRAMVNHATQRRVNHTWLHPWNWTYQEAVCAVDTDTSEIVLPPDYHSLTKDGHILDDRGVPMTWMRPLLLTRLLKRQTVAKRHGLPTHYTEFLSTLDPVSGGYIGGRRIILYPFTTVAFNVSMYYKTLPPIITDVPDAEDLSTISNMEAIPVEYQETWFLDGVLADLLDKQGDGRSAVYEARYQTGKQEAFADENQGQNTPRRFGKRWGGYRWGTHRRRVF